MTKAKRYDTVVLLEAIGCCQIGEKGTVVEVYTTPYEAYDIEIVTDEGETKGLVEAVRPEQIEVVPAISDEDWEDWLFEHDPKVIQQAQAARERLKHDDGKTLDEVAKELSITLPAVSQPPLKK